MLSGRLISSNCVYGPLRQGLADRQGRDREEKMCVCVYVCMYSMDVHMCTLTNREVKLVEIEFLTEQSFLQCPILSISFYKSLFLFAFSCTPPPPHHQSSSLF